MAFQGLGMCFVFLLVAGAWLRISARVSVRSGNQQWSERLHQQQQAQNDQMMQLLQTMAGARAPQPTYQAQPSATPTKFCPECGKRISVDSKHCPECGAKQL